jgi:hypothetical protein
VTSGVVQLASAGLANMVMKPFAAKQGACFTSFANPAGPASALASCFSCVSVLSTACPVLTLLSFVLQVY